jgi:hypothetical protein
MGVLDFFKSNKNENSKLIDLQNIIFNSNSTKLEVNRKQLNDALSKYVFNHSKIVNDCVNLIGSTIDPKTFFTRFDLLTTHLKALSKVENHYSFSGISPSAQFKKLLTDKEMMINAFIDKSYKKLLSKASSLKTEKAKQNNINKFFDNMYSYKNNMSSLNIEHLEKLKNSIDLSKVKIDTSGKIIYDELKKEIDASLYEYIYNKVVTDKVIHKFFPEGMPKQTVFHIISEHFKGRRPENINTDICNIFLDISNKNLEGITRTICNISSSTLEMFRHKKSGIHWYVWRTCMDIKVRPSHAYLEDVLVNYDDPPFSETLLNEEAIDKYNAGERYTCRCYAEALIKLDFISWPHKVFYQNRIQTMTKEQFESIM